MSDKIIIRDVLPERIQLHEPAFYNGLSTYQLYVQETTEETPLSLTEWLKLVYGVTPEFSKSATHVQWRVEGSETWIDLFPLSDIKGDKGDGTQLQVSATHIQWKNVGDTVWIDLIALSTIKGDSGHTPYIPDSSTTWWIDGEDTGLQAIGKDGDNGHTPYIGENGNWWIDGVDSGLPSRGLQGEPLLYSDLIPEQIAELQAPALEAAGTANASATNANNAAEAANAVAGNIVELQQAIDLVEAQRVTNEDARTQAETTRDNSETARNEAEQLRGTAEGERASAELIRIQNENERIDLIGDLNTILDDINGEVI